jgi:SAM-dependent methyltransferase
MKQKEWFREWFDSSWYHKLYFERNELEAQQFLSRLINYLKCAEGSRMLDVACGKGRHSRYLASLGYDVTGIDLSPNSINYARQFETANLNFYEHDMRSPFWTNYFDYTFNFFTSFGYFATFRENTKAIKMMVQSLKSSGTLVLDYLNVHYCEERLVRDEIKPVNGTNFEIVRWQDDTHFYKQITIPEKHKQVFTEKICKFAISDFTEMLSFFNMQITDVFGDYELNRYDTRNTPRMIIIAKKDKHSAA